MPLERDDIGLIAQEISVPIVIELEKQTALLEQLVKAQIPALIGSDDLDVLGFLNRIKNHPALSVVDNPEGDNNDTEDAHTV